MDFEIFIYKSSSGKSPYLIWEERLSEEVQGIIASRLNRLRIGNFGDCKALGGTGGVLELRIHAGPGYRIYFGKVGRAVVLLLCGGDKSTQRRDIEKAEMYWAEYLQNMEETNG